MHELEKKYPGTVIGVVNKNSPTFTEELGLALEKFKQEFNKPTHEKIKRKIEIYGTAVSCVNPDGGPIVEGNIIEVLPCGCEWLDPKWKDCTIVVKDHETKEVSHWRPEFITFIGRN